MDTENTSDQNESKPKMPPRTVHGDESQGPPPIDHTDPELKPMVKQTEEL